MLRLAAAVFLVVLAIAVLASPRFVRTVSGYRPLVTPTAAAIDDPPGVDERDAPRFFAERNRVVFTVPRAMTLGELVRLYQVDFPHVRRQIAAQAGLADSADERPLAAGQRLEITLTPPDEMAP